MRKLRWGRKGTGKRGGVRVIYFYYNETCPLYLLMIYAKSMQTDLSPEGKKAVSAFAAMIKQRYQH